MSGISGLLISAIQISHLLWFINTQSPLHAAKPSTNNPRLLFSSLLFAPKQLNSLSFDSEPRPFLVPVAVAAAAAVVVELAMSYQWMPSMMQTVNISSLGPNTRASKCPQSFPLSNH